MESTNSLISLLTEICDPVYLLGLLRASLGRYVSAQQPINTNGNGVAARSMKLDASGYIFGFNGMGMCILRLPAPVIEVEAPKLASIVTEVSLAPLVDEEANDRHQAIHHLKCYQPDKQFITSYSASNA